MGRSGLLRRAICWSTICRHLLYYGPREVFGRGVLMVPGNADVTPSSALFTVGHSNHSLEDFLKLLSRHAIEVLVDTRSHPYSQYVTHFNREELTAALKHAGIKYLYLGRELGGRPDEDEYFDVEGHVLYY